VLLTGQFKVSFPKVFDIIGTGVLGFLLGFLIWSFVSLVVSASPIGQKAFARDIGFGDKFEQAQGPYVCWWCDLVNAATAAAETRHPAKESISRLLEKAGEKRGDDVPGQADPNIPTTFSSPGSLQGSR